jgi:hypothetical protein
MTYISSHNPKYRNMVVNTSILRAFSASKYASVRLQDGTKGALVGRFFVKDILVDGVVFQRAMDFEEILPFIKSIAISGEIVAKRKHREARLLTTGFGWREYSLRLPEKYRK